MGRGLCALLIGGFALGFHRYVRMTRDLDLGVTVTVAELDGIRDEIDRREFTTKLRRPDGNDRLGGVLDVFDETGAMVQIVNFENAASKGFPRVITDAVAAAQPVRPDSRLRLVPLPQLIALELYAGGEESLRDIREVLARNPDADVSSIRDLCERSTA